MKRMCARSILVAVFLSAPALMLAAGPAAAHEHRHVAGGKYEFTVGWGDEPTYSGFKNSVSLAVKDAGGKPLTDIGDTLKVDVATGAQKMTLPLKASDEEPGSYLAALVPTRPGTYAFTFSGTIHGDAINETFTSSETTFDNVDDTADILFPAKDPSTGELAARLDREVPRLTAAAKNARGDASGARTVGIIGLVIGAIGVIVGGVALSRRS